MKLTFLGTRGNIDASTRRHRRHTSLMVSYRGENVMVDCGEDWVGALGRVHPSALVLTHAHSDHVGGLARGAPCTVYATSDVWSVIAKWPIKEQRRLRPRAPLAIRGIVFEAFPVEHSVRAPAVGYRITAGAASVFYVPDVLDIPDRAQALADLRLYIGDGAVIHRSLVRRQGGRFAGHVSVVSQLDWCARAGVRRTIFTHCGTGIVGRDKGAERTVADLARARGIDAEVAYDGMERLVR